MRIPHACRLPRYGYCALRGDVGWHWYSDRHAWGRPTRYVRVWFVSGVPRNWRDITMSAKFMKKPDTGQDLPAAPKRPHWIDQDVEERYPKLYDAMASAVYEDGSAKLPGVLILKPRMGQLSATLKIDGTGLMLRAEAPTLRELLELLDTILGGATVPWESDPYAAEKPRRPRRTG